MTESVTSSNGKHQDAPWFNRRIMTLFVVLSALWVTLSWHMAAWRYQERTSALIGRDTIEARQRLPLISANMERVLSRLQGLAAVVASGNDVTTPLAAFGPGVKTSALSLEARQAEWTRRSDLAALNKRLAAVAVEMGVDVISLMNASGDCVAASNATEPTSFIGTNYADRGYFTEALGGRRSRQFAMGRITKVPGLFFSAPVVVKGQVLGVVAIKSDISRFTTAVNRLDTFATDEQGVIILAANRSLEMRALPGAAIHKMSSAQQMSRYQRTAFDTVLWEANGVDSATVRLPGSLDPHVYVQSELTAYGITVHILAPVHDMDVLRDSRKAGFLLLSLAGILMIALALGGRAYLLRERAFRQSMLAANEALKLTNSKLDALTRTDPLTGCANRRHFQERLESELGRAGRHGSSCSLLMADIDFFKKVNDRHGHAGGDAALRHFAQIVRAQLRREEEFARVGGEEFAVLMPECDLAGAVAVAERIRCAIEATPVPFEQGHIPLTTSLGVACWGSPSESADALVQRADKALYDAKNSGRNRICTAHQSESAADMAKQGA